VDYLQGMGKVGKKFVLILDVDRVLSAPELLAAGALGSATEETHRTVGTTPDGAAEGAS
jgi:hypothetical protein